MANLECSSKGDKRFSAFYANVSVHGLKQSIEAHYQLSKRFGNFIPATWRDAKGRKPTHFTIGHDDYPLEYLSDWYECLWLAYFIEHKELLPILKQYDSFSDMFAKPGTNSQAKVIQKIKEQGLHNCIQNNKLWQLLITKKQSQAK